MLGGLLAAGRAAAGSGTDHEITLSGGLQWVDRTDTLLSPLPHRGAFPGGSLAWSARGTRSVNEVALSLHPGTTRSVPKWEFLQDGESITADASPATLVDIRYAWGYRVDLGDAVLHVGPTLAGHFEDLTLVNGFLGMKAYLGVFELGPWADLRVPLGDRAGLETQLWAPLGAWVTRNRYSVHDDTYIWHNRDNNVLKTIVRYLGAGSPQTWNHYQAVHWRGGFTHDLAKHFAWILAARVDGFAYSQPQPEVQWQLGLETGLRGRL